MKPLITKGSQFRKLHGKQKLQYLWDYYKLHFVITGIILYIIGYLLYGALSHKNQVLYAAFINVAPGDALTWQLTDGFLEAQHLAPDKNAFGLYPDLYLTEDHESTFEQYVYASNIKILGAIGSEQLDLVLMDQEALEYFLRNDSLCDIETLMPDTDLTLYQDAEAYPLALCLSETPLMKKSGFTAPVYVGIISNSPRKETAVSYIQYLLMIK